MLFSFGSVLFFSWGGNSGETGLIAIWRNPVFARACRNSRKTDREVDQKSLFIIYPFGNSSDRLPARCCTHTQAQISSSIENQDTHCINIYRRLFVDVSRKYIFIYIYILSNTIHQLHVAMLGVSHKPLTITLQIKRIHLLVPNVLPDNSTCGLFLGLSDPFNGFVQRPNHSNKTQMLAKITRYQQVWSQLENRQISCCSITQPKELHVPRILSPLY